MLQFSPVNPSLQMHLYPPSRSTHVPLSQGSGSQLFGSVRIKIYRYYKKGKCIVFTAILIAYLGSTRSLITLLRPWIRRIKIISAWWFRTSSKLSKQKFEETIENLNFESSETTKCYWILDTTRMLAWVSQLYNNTGQI